MTLQKLLHLGVFWVEHIGVGFRCHPPPRLQSLIITPEKATCGSPPTVRISSSTPADPRARKPRIQSSKALEWEEIRTVWVGCRR